MTDPAPEDCSGLDDIRAAIDRRDRELVRLLGERAGYVCAAAAFKTNETAVRAPERHAAMLALQWATDEGLDPDLVESLFRQLVEHFIAREIEGWQENQGG